MKIACSYDGTVATRRALGRAIPLAEALGGELTLVTVGPGADDLLAEAVETVPPGIGVRPEPGFTIDELVSLSAEYDLLVMGSRDVAYRTRWLMGSTTDQVSRLVRSDLLVVDARRPGDGPYRRILVGVDGGAPSMRAVALAAGWARVFATLLTVAHVFPAGAGSEETATAHEIAERARAAAEEIGAVADVVLVPGLQPAPVLAQMAADSAADLIVVADRGAGRQDWPLHSVPATLLHNLDGDLLLAHWEGG